MRAIFFGTPDFAAHVLSHLLENGVEVVAVVTKPDKAQGRSSRLISTPVKSVAESCVPPLPVFQPETVSASEWIPVLEAFQADLFIVVAYGEIIKQHLLDMPKVACINVHASILPDYRGAAPIQRSIINGETETGITIMHMAKKMDAGDIIAIEKVVITPEMTYGELEAELCKVGSKLILETVRNFESGNVSRTVQDHTLATFAPKIELEDCRIDWTKSAKQIHNLVRGVNPHPGAWCQVVIKGQNKRLRVISTKVIEEDAEVVTGQIIPSPKNTLYVGCGRGILSLLQIQLEGKKAISAGEFIRGMPAGALEFTC
jgi:methionyl-tRNA formyltransferase